MSDQIDQQVKNAPKKLAQGVANTYKNINKAIKAAKVAVKAVKALLIALKAIITFFLAGGWILVAFAVFVVIFYAIVASPVTVGKELALAKEEGTYAGKVLSFFLDVDDRWDEELDQEAIEKYESYKDKCLDDPEITTLFQEKQAAPYTLPYSMLISIERIKLLMDELDPEADVWFPDPEPLYEQLKTYYTWVDSDIDYTANYSYNYSYSYKWDEYIPAEYDDDGNMVSEGYTVTNYESGSGNGAQDLERLFEVKLISEADAFDNIYVYEYDNHITDEDIATGDKRKTHSGVVYDNTQKGYDEHETVLLSTDLRDEIDKDAMQMLMSNVRSGAYDLEYDIEYRINSTSKTYQPINSVSTTGNQFERLVNVLTDLYGHKTDPLDLEMIFHLAAEYDESTAYKFSANDGYLYFSGSYAPVFYNGSLGQITWPVAAPGTIITSHFGQRPPVTRGGKVISSGFHGGVDIANAQNVPIYAASDGIVIFAGMNGSLTSGYGRTVMIDHGRDNNGKQVVTLYAHMSSICVKNGQSVMVGEQIGIMGTTGSSTGTHLHFEIRLDNERKNPLQFYQEEAYQNYL